MPKNYYIVNENGIQNDYNCYYRFLILLCLIAVIFLICNFYLNYKINITTILILLIIAIVCNYTL